MSGHSKWAKIKRQKGANDAARGKVFTKLSKQITLAAQQGGGDPDMNFALRIAIDKAKAENLPNDRIDKAVKRGTGELEGGKLVSIIYEGYGPGSTAILIQSQTDNTNRALTEIKTVMNNKGGKLGAEGSVSWQFTEKGYFILEPFIFKESEKYGKDGEYHPVDIDDMSLELMEVAGVDDIKIQEEDDQKYIELTSARDDFNDVHEALKEKGYKIAESELAWMPNDSQNISTADQDKLDSLLEALEENDEVSNVWHNAA